MNTQNPEDVVLSPELEEEVALRAYWTEARMEAAVPVPLSVPTEALDDTHVSTSHPEAAMRGESREPDGETFRPRPKFSTSLVEDRTVFPYKCVGKLFMTHQGQDKVCSAYVIGESTIGTAGHCVYRYGKWATNFLFLARYDKGTCVGKWGMKCMATLKNWEKTEKYQYDMAFGLAPGPIRPTTGKLGWMAGYPVDQAPYTQIGYPGRPIIPEYPFDGHRMWKTVGNYISHTESDATPLIIRASGNMTEGCSGGPWAVLKEGHWRVNGVNSHRPKGDPDHIHSPYFGNGFRSLIKWMKENGGDTPAAV